MPVWLMLGLCGHVCAEVGNEIDRHSKKSNRASPHLLIGAKYALVS